MQLLGEAIHLFSGFPPNPSIWNYLQIFSCGGKAVKNDVLYKIELQEKATGLSLSLIQYHPAAFRSKPENTLLYRLNIFKTGLLPDWTLKIVMFSVSCERRSSWAEGASAKRLIQEHFDHLPGGRRWRKRETAAQLDSEDSRWLCCPG